MVISPARLHTPVVSPGWAPFAAISAAAGLSPLIWHFDGVLRFDLDLFRYADARRRHGAARKERDKRVRRPALPSSISVDDTLAPITTARSRRTIFLRCSEAADAG